jgi:hypothetical protein
MRFVAVLWLGLGLASAHPGAIPREQPPMRFVAVLWLGLGLASAHPGAIAAGRASCGEEYTSPGTAFEIPDVRESCTRARWTA